MCDEQKGDGSYQSPYASHAVELFTMFRSALNDEWQTQRAHEHEPSCPLFHSAISALAQSQQQQQQQADIKTTSPQHAQHLATSSLSLNVEPIGRPSLSMMSPSQLQVKLVGDVSSRVIASALAASSPQCTCNQPPPSWSQTQSHSQSQSQSRQQIPQLTPAICLTLRAAEIVAAWLRVAFEQLCSAYALLVSCF